MTHYHLTRDGRQEPAQHATADEARLAMYQAADTLVAGHSNQGARATWELREGGVLATWDDGCVNGRQELGITACATAHGGPRPPMTVRAEVWGLAADDDGIWLISGDDAWRSRAIPADTDPHWTVQRTLRKHGALGAAKVVHSTSWRAEGESVILTYVACLDCPAPRAHWPGARPVSRMLPEVVGNPLTHAADKPPVPRYVDVLLHAIRHLAFLERFSATEAAAMGPVWKRHLEAWQPALAGMYSAVHEPEVIAEAG